MKCYTFCRRHSSGYIQRRLDYFFISNVLQESVKSPNVLAAFFNDHSLIFSCLWKHNNSLCEKRTYINSIKKHISTLENCKNENITDEQSVWEYLKYKIRKFSKKIFQKKLLVPKKLNLQL